MTENLRTSALVVAPLLLLMAVGYLGRVLGVMTAEQNRTANRLVFYITLPALVFMSIVEGGSAEGGGALLLYFAAAIVVVFAVCALLVPLFCRGKASTNESEAERRASLAGRRGALLQCTFRSNDGLYAMAVSAALLPASQIGVHSLALAVTIPLFNVLGILCFEVYQGGRVRIGKVLVDLIKNPIMIAVLAAFLWKATGWQLPGLAADLLGTLKSICTPLAFLLLGGTLRFGAMKKNRRAILFGSAGKLLLIPIAAMAAAWLCGFRGAALTVVLTIFGAPCASSCYPLTVAMGGDDELAGQMQAMESAASIVTMFLLIYGAKSLGWIA